MPLILPISDSYHFSIALTFIVFTACQMISLLSSSNVITPHAIGAQDTIADFLLKFLDMTISLHVKFAVCRGVVGCFFNTSNYFAAT